MEIAEDFGVSTTLETVEIVCPPPDTDDGSIIVTKHDELDVDTATTPPLLVTHGRDTQP